MQPPRLALVLTTENKQEKIHPQKTKTKNWTLGKKNTQKTLN